MSFESLDEVVRAYDGKEVSEILPGLRLSFHEHDQKGPQNSICVSSGEEEMIIWLTEFPESTHHLINVVKHALYGDRLEDSNRTIWVTVERGKPGEWGAGTWHTPPRKSSKVDEYRITRQVRRILRRGRALFE